MSILFAALAIAPTSLVNGPGHPEERVETKEYEYANEKNRHEPVRIVEVRILPPVMVRRVREIADEFAVRVGMAFFTRLDDVGAAQM